MTVRTAAVCAIRVLVSAVIAGQGAANTGCSFAYTRGPEPAVHPPPPCTPSNEAPITDTIFAALSVGAVVAGTVAMKNGDLGTGLAGLGATILGGFGTLGFTTSAVVGYTRTAACRDWLEEHPKYAPLMRPGRPLGPSSLLGPAPMCPSERDAPLLCAKGPVHE
jgi:hypothetical protein